MNEIKVEIRYADGSDIDIVNAARRSFGKESSLESDGTLNKNDESLLKYLVRGMSSSEYIDILDEIVINHDKGNHEKVAELMWRWRNTACHDTPFNHVHVSFDIEVPIYTMRQLQKHEYLVLSEFSRRYVKDKIEFYTPEIWRKTAKNVKQGSSSFGITSDDEQLNFIDQHREKSINNYNYMTETLQIAPELARGELPVSAMTSATWSGTLGAFAKMCRERLDSHSQKEAQIVAEKIKNILSFLYPVSTPLLINGVPD